MTEDLTPSPRPLPVPKALGMVLAAPHGLLALGTPGCAACTLLPASLVDVARVRPGLTIAIGEFTTREDWALRDQCTAGPGVGRAVGER